MTVMLLEETPAVLSLGKRCAREDALEIDQEKLIAQRNGQSYLLLTYQRRCLPVPSVIKPEEKEFVVDSGASMHMLSRKDLNSAELETARVSESQRHLLQLTAKRKTKEEATVYVKELDLFVTINILQKIHGPFFQSENSAKITGIPTIGPVNRNHSSLKMADESIPTQRTMYPSFSRVYRLALQAQLHVHLQHQYCRKQSIPHQQEVRVRVAQYGETRRMNQQKPKNK